MDTITSTRSSSEGTATSTRDSELQALADDVAAKLSTRNTKEANEKAKQAVYDDAVTDHNNKKAAQASAASLEEAGKAKAAFDYTEDATRCASSKARVTAAASAQKASDETFLNNALAFITALKAKLSSFQQESTAAATTTTAATAAAFLSLGERVKLRQMVKDFQRRASSDDIFKYLDSARLSLRSDEVSAITSALDLVVASVQTETQTVFAEYEKHVAATDAAYAACMETAGKNKADSEAMYATALAKAVTKMDAAASAEATATTNNDDDEDDEDEPGLAVVVAAAGGPAGVVLPGDAGPFLTSLPPAVLVAVVAVVAAVAVVVAARPGLRAVALVVVALPCRCRRSDRR